jgi:hypothetical protein
MFPLGFVIPAVVILLVALYVAVRDVGRALVARPNSGNGPLLTTVGETAMILATIAVFIQGRPAGLIMAPVGGYLLFFGGTVLVFVGMSMESRRAARR